MAIITKEKYKLIDIIRNRKLREYTATIIRAIKIKELGII